jgi:hypothetical protein
MVKRGFGVVDDMTRAVTVMLETLPARLADGINESMVAEALDLFTIDELMRKPATRETLDQIREKLCYALVKELRDKFGPMRETLSTGLYACEKCHATPVLCVVVQESPCVVTFQCRRCSYEERKTLLDGELVEIRSEGSPVDWRGEPIVKKGKGKKKKDGPENGTHRTEGQADRKAVEGRVGEAVWR